jgi:phage terminase small subunit
MKPKIITEIKKFLIEESIYTPKDEITLTLLETTYRQYNDSVKDVKKYGQTIQQTDSNGKVRTIINPSFKNQLNLQKELFKLIDSLYLTPKSRKSKKDDGKIDDNNPFLDMIKDISKVEKRYDK